MIPNDLHVCLDFLPSFLDPCKMELCREAESWLFTVTIRSYTGGNERKWSASTTNTWYVDKIVALSRTVVKEARTDDRMILDGIRLRCSITENDVEKVHEYRCPEQGDPEWFLAGAFLVRAQNLLKDQELINYIELLEGYFERLPAKLFDETPRRLRIYGYLSIHDAEGLADLIAKVTNEQVLVLDLTNLQGMGTILYKQFEPLKAIKDLKVLVSAVDERALKQVREIGFKEEQVIVM
jgi:hypothetical protein